MDSPEIIIFDPFNKTESELIKSIIKDKTKYKCEIIQDVESNSLDFYAQPKLNFVILDHCDHIDRINIYNNFFYHYRKIPTIGVINCNMVCSDCSIMHKYIWNILSIPINQNDLLINIKKYIHDFSISTKNVDLIIRKKIGFNLIIGDSECLGKIKEKIVQIASYDVNVLINGETGTGKELCAKLLHFLSPRSSKPFVPLNCGSIPKELFENELFGHKKGAYTNANSSEKGVISAANEGTLFLDEIESLPESMQVKLLRFLEEKKYKPLGQANYCDADVRIIAAAKDNLWEKVKKKQFREDLFYRLSVVKVFLPPLHERKEDIPILVNYFVERYSTLYKKDIKGVLSSAILKLIHNDWPGNVRELENTIQAAVVTCKTEWIDINDIEFIKQDSVLLKTKVLTFNTAKQRSINEFEQKYLESIMISTQGNISEAAKTANKDRRAFYRLLKKHQIEPSAFRQ